VTMVRVLLVTKQWEEKIAAVEAEANAAMTGGAPKSYAGRSASGCDFELLCQREQASERMGLCSGRRWRRTQR